MRVYWHAAAVLTIAFLEISLAQEQKPDMKTLTWVSGCWKSEDKGKIIEEQWTQLAGESMLGVSRTVRGGKMVAYEFVRIVRDGDDVFYIAHPSGQTEASFKLVRWSNGEAVFGNPEHDFPQRIIYRKGSDGSLQARIEGTAKGKERGVNFPMKRVKCE